MAVADVFDALTSVKLNRGETAVVARYLFDTHGRPVVRVIEDPYGKDLDKPYDRKFIEEPQGHDYQI